jgi:hypothetical protein
MIGVFALTAALPRHRSRVFVFGADAATRVVQGGTPSTRSLPSLPAEGLALQRGSGVELVGTDGRSVTRLPGLRLLSPLAHPLLEDRRAHTIWLLDANRDALVNTSGLRGYTSSSLSAFGTDGLPRSCVRGADVGATVFASCTDGAQTTLVALRKGGLTTLAHTSNGPFWPFELSPDGRTVAVGDLGGSGWCRNETVLVDERTLRATRVHADFLGFLSSSAPVSLARLCSSERGTVSVGQRVIARGVLLAALWDDAGRRLH